MMYLSIIYRAIAFRECREKERERERERKRETRRLSFVSGRPYSEIRDLRRGSLVSKLDESRQVEAT